MNNNVNGMVKINDNKMVGPTVPNGFIVREKLIDGNAVSLEYGTYVSDSVFLGVPIHFGFKDKLIPLKREEGFNYYLVPEVMQFAVSSYMNKKTEKINPLLVAPTEKKGSVLISGLNFSVENPEESIINVKILDNSKVIRKYIDKDRKTLALIMANTDAGLINPSTRVEITYGKLGTDVHTVKTYTFSPMISAGVDTTTFMYDSEEPNKTEFINLSMMFENKKEKKDFKHNDRR